MFCLAYHLEKVQSRVGRRAKTYRKAQTDVATHPEPQPTINLELVLQLPNSSGVMSDDSTSLPDCTAARHHVLVTRPTMVLVNTRTGHLGQGLPRVVPRMGA